MCYSHLDHSPNMKLHETEARARELAAGLQGDRRAFGAFAQGLAKWLAKHIGGTGGTAGSVNWNSVRTMVRATRIARVN